MRTLMMMSIVFAFAAGPVLATTTHCQDPVTHKRISCKNATAPASQATPETHAAPKTSTPMAAPSAADTGSHKGKKCGNSYIAQNKVCHKG